MKNCIFHEVSCNEITSTCDPRTMSVRFAKYLILYNNINFNIKKTELKDTLCIQITCSRATNNSIMTGLYTEGIFHYVLLSLSNAHHLLMVEYLWTMI